MRVTSDWRRSVWFQSPDTFPLTPIFVFPDNLGYDFEASRVLPLSTDQELLPTKCIQKGSTVTAQGKFNTYLPALYERIGDGILLYIYGFKPSDSLPTTGVDLTPAEFTSGIDGYELGAYPPEKPFYLLGQTSWKVTEHVIRPGLYSTLACFVQISRVTVGTGGAT